MRLFFGILLTLVGGTLWLAGHEFKQTVILEKQMVLQQNQIAEQQLQEQQLRNQLQQQNELKNQQIKEITDCYQSAVEQAVDMEKQIIMLKGLCDSLRTQVDKAKEEIKKIQLSKHITVKGSAYTNDPHENCGKGITYTGTKATPGRTVAVSHDLKHLMGKWIYVQGLGYRKVEDLMPANRKQSLDIVVNNKKEAYNFGIRNVKISLIAKNDM